MSNTMKTVINVTPKKRALDQSAGTEKVYMVDQPAGTEKVNIVDCHTVSEMSGIFTPPLQRIPSKLDGDRHMESHPHLVRSSPPPINEQVTPYGYAHVPAHRTESFEEQQSSTSTHRPPVTEVYVPKQISQACKYAEAESDSSANFENLYLFGQHENHRLKRQLDMERAESRQLKRQLIEWQRRYYSQQRSRPVVHTAWTVPESKN